MAIRSFSTVMHCLTSRSGSPAASVLAFLDGCAGRRVPAIARGARAAARQAVKGRAREMANTRAGAGWAGALVGSAARVAPSRPPWRALALLRRARAVGQEACSSWLLVAPPTMAPGLEVAQWTW
jgi:hypothetical protein